MNISDIAVSIIKNIFGIFMYIVLAIVMLVMVVGIYGSNIIDFVLVNEVWGNIVQFSIDSFLILGAVILSIVFIFGAVMNIRELFEKFIELFRMTDYHD